MSEELNPITRTEMFLAKAAGQNTPELAPITRVERFLQNLIDHIKSIGIGGGGATPDWNAAEGEPGHILNRTHYDTIGKYVEEVTIYDDLGGETLPLKNELIIGETYTIHWGNTDYVREALDSAVMSPDAAGRPVLGNLSFFGVGEDTGEPFIIASTAPGIIAIVASGEGEEIQFSIDGKVNVPMPDKYLPMSARSYVITLTDEDTEVGAAIGVNSCTYDDFIDILYGGGTVLIKKNPPADVENIYAKFYRPVSWDFINMGDANALAVKIYDNLKNVHTTNPNPDLMFKGTKMPPTA